MYGTEEHYFRFSCELDRRQHLPYCAWKPHAPYPIVKRIRSISYS